MLNYKKIINKLPLTAILLTAWFVHAEGKNEVSFMPLPNSVTYAENEGWYKLDNNASIGSASGECHGLALKLQESIKAKTGMDLPIVDGKAPITLSIDKNLKGSEHYTIRISESGVTLTGSGDEALFRALTTFEQILRDAKNEDGIYEIPTMAIDDSPRYRYRALMLDPARNFLPAEDVKRFIDQMARYKFNVLQLHLSDDQGWRLEMEKHPEISSEQRYTKDEIRDLIKYAGDRYIEIVPEIDIPGHTAAFLAVYPELGCVNKRDEPISVGSTVNRMLCASNEKVYTIFEDVLGEIAELFPSEYIHLGGDESAIESNWAQCDSCKALMEHLGYDKASQLMIPFFDKMLGYVRDKGKHPILWCELNNIYPPADDYLFPYPDDVTLVTWRARLTPTCLELTGKSGFPLIMAPGEHAYLDYPQYRGDLPEFNNWGMPTTTLKQSYNFDPGYGLPEEKQSHVQGVMGTLWGEAIKDINRVFYMTFPRGMALSEAGWTNIENRSWDSFKERLYPNLYELMKEGVSFRVPFEIAEDQMGR